MRSSAVFAILAVAGAAQAQSQVPTYQSSLNMTIDPNSVPIQTRATWCSSETSTCNLLCGDDTDSISCSPDTLAYNCTCASNGSAPGLQYYQQTMPTFICQELFGQCNVAHTDSARDQEACKKNIQDLCGTLDPPKSAIQPSGSSSDSDSQSTTSSMSSATKTSGHTASATGDVKTTTKSGGFAAPTMAPLGRGIAAAAAAGAMAVLI